MLAYYFLHTFFPFRKLLGSCSCHPLKYQVLNGSNFLDRLLHCLTFLYWCLLVHEPSSQVYNIVLKPTHAIDWIPHTHHVFGNPCLFTMSHFYIIGTPIYQKWQTLNYWTSHFLPLPINPLTFILYIYISKTSL